MLAAYRASAGKWDEAFDAEGAIRPHWQHLLSAQFSQTPAKVAAFDETCSRLLKDYGVTYNAPGVTGEAERPWSLDSLPLVISPEEWSLLGAAVAQRAQLLDQILADIYGPRKLLTSGVLPPEIILANPAFLRAATGIVPPNGRFLSLYAVDLARSPDGRWWTVGDRTDAPSGLGYALENRIVLSRVHAGLIRDCQVERIARFYAAFRDGLLAQAPRMGRQPRVVLLTPGPHHATYFEQVYLARYLGFTLVEGEDLTVRDTGVFLKTLSGLSPVDVIFRYVSGWFCDPLELRDDSLLGVPGLLQAQRAGQVVIANALGAGVVETPALLPFLPGLCQRILGEELKLPPVATWWCGGKSALEAVTSGQHRLVVKEAFAARPTPVMLAPGQPPHGELQKQLAQDPQLYVGQEFVELSTAPAWRAGALQPRRLMVRMFAAADSNGKYVVLPGGLTRVGDTAESIYLSAQTGGGSKDTWVISRTAPDETTLLPTSQRVSALSRSGFILSSRLADNLYWLGRYMERIEFGCRLARCVLQRLVDDSEQNRLGAVAYLLDSLAESGRAPEPLWPENGSRRNKSPTVEQVQAVITAAVFEHKNPGGLAADVARVARIATAVRDRLSTDSWRLLQALHEAMRQEQTPHTVGEQLAILDRVLELALSFSGQAMDGMTRDQGWSFLDMGRRLERASNLCRLIALALVRVQQDDGPRLQALLEIANSLMTYRSRYVFGPDPAPVLDLLLADDSNPRSVAFQLAALYQHAKGLRDGAGKASRKAGLRAEKDESGRALAHRIVQEAFSQIRLLDVDALASLQQRGRRKRLSVLLKRLRRDLEELSQTLTRTYLTHVTNVRPLGGGG